jgi:signal transduction histidine kinase
LVLMLFVAFIGMQAVIALIILSQVPERVREEMVARDLSIRISPVLDRLTNAQYKLSDIDILLFNDLGFFLDARPFEMGDNAQRWDALAGHIASKFEGRVLTVESVVANSEPPFKMFASERETVRPIAVNLQLSNGTRLSYRGDIALPVFSPLRVGILADVGVRVFAVALIALLITRWLVSPLNRLAAQAAALGRNLDSEPISVTGPREIERTARAFNEMQTRLRNFVNERTRMLTAISHDLRTPITRVLLRLELMPPSDARDRSIADLTELTDMVNETLAFVRSEHDSTPAESIAIDALVAERIRFANTATIAYALPPTDIQVIGRRTSLVRLFDNLIENTLRYSSEARISVATRVDQVAIEIDDDGPGIPADELERVFEPFYRVEKSRNAHSGGTGLGLAIARDIARAHGGDVQLQNRAEGGLRVTVTLPLANNRSALPSDGNA